MKVVSKEIRETVQVVGPEAFDNLVKTSINAKRMQSEK